MNNSEKISVIVPAYNVAPYIERCIRSILQQTCANLEIIVVDDGSSDGTSEILDEIAKNELRIHVIHQENSGVTKARLTGVAAATGEWIGFVDGDDNIEPDMYERLLNNAHRYGADISHCGYQMVFPNRVDYYYNTGRLVEQDNLTGLKDLLEGSFIEPGLWNKLFHKSLFHSLFNGGMMDISIKNMEDLLMNYYLFKEAKCSIYEDVCPYHYLIREGSAATSRLSEHKLSDPLKVFQEIALLESKNKQLHNIVEKRIVYILINLATMPRSNQEELARPYRIRARSMLRDMLFAVLCGQEFGMKLKGMTLWATIWPASYSFVHMVYAKARGTNERYLVK